MSPNAPKNPTRPIRVDLGDWADFGEAAKSMGTDRSAALRAFMHWYLRKPGAKLPTRPQVASEAASQVNES
ncbi:MULTISPECIES: hypothetical protein [unclassified Streptomyces]|uniref:hypothetical protein n=1 Tax=unclassified Streptomyces TaxID=2593676 RepID=UPI0033318B6E